MGVEQDLLTLASHPNFESWIISASAGNPQGKRENRTSMNEGIHIGILLTPSFQARSGRCKLTHV